MDWKKYEGKLLHIQVGSVCPYGPGEDEVSIKVLETDEYVNFRVDTEG